MGDAVMQDDQLEAIAEQVKEKMILWLDEKHIYPFPQRSPDISTQLLERMVRVEEGIKHQNETIEKLIIQIDRRFETMDRRFKEMSESMDRRFESMDRRFKDMGETMDKRFNRLYVFFSGVFLTILAGMVTLIIQGFQV